MSDGEREPPVEPVRNYARGLTIPAIIILSCGAIGALWVIVTGNANPVAIGNAVKLGAWIGFFISFVGGLEIAAGLLFATRNIMNGLYLAAGYFTVWIITFYALKLLW